MPDVKPARRKRGAALNAVTAAVRRVEGAAVSTILFGDDRRLLVLRVHGVEIDCVLEVR